MSKKKPSLWEVIKPFAMMAGAIALSVWLQRKLNEPDAFNLAVARAKRLIPSSPPPPEPPHAWIRELYDGTR